MKKIRYWQQGDVLVKSIDSMPSGTREEIVRLVLAEGESTGHAHRIVWVGNQIGLVEDKTSAEAKRPIKLFRIGGQLYVEADVPFTVTHEEHKAIDVPAGKYQVGIVKEYDHFAEEARNVVD